MNRIVQIISNKKGKEKVLIITKLAISVLVLVFSFMQITGIWDKAIYVSEPFLGVLMLMQAIEYWNKNRKVAIFSLGVSLLIFAGALFIFIDIVFNS